MDTQEVGPRARNAIVGADQVTRSAAGAEQLLSRRHVAQLQRRILEVDQVVGGDLPVVQPAAELRREHVRILRRGALHPAPCGLIADHQAQGVIGERLLLRADHAELFANEADIRLGTGQELPAGADVEALRIFGQDLRRIHLGIDRDGIEVHVLADTVLEQVVHLGDACRLQRTGIRTAGVDEVDQHDLALQQVVEEAHVLALMRREFDVREVVSAPDLARVDRVRSPLSISLWSVRRVGLLCDGKAGQTE